MRDERDPIENVRSMLLTGGHASEDDLKAIDKEIKEDRKRLRRICQNQP